MRSAGIYTLIISSTLFFTTTLYAQVSNDALKSAFIIQLSNEIEWPSDNRISRYRIGFYTQDESIFRLMQRVALNASIHRRPIEIINVKSLNELEGLNILYIDQARSKDIARIAGLIEKKSILLISESAVDKKYIMLNMFVNQNNNGISFEINKANILIEGLQVSKELLLQGGNEIDIRELYKEMKEELAAEKNELSMQKETIRQQIDEIYNQRKELRELNEAIDALVREIDAKAKKELVLSEDILGNQNKISAQNKHIKNQQVEIKNQKKELAKQEKLFMLRSHRLDSIEIASQMLMSQLEAQGQDIEVKEVALKARDRLLFIITAFVIVLIISGFLLFKAYRQKKKANLELQYAQNQLIQQEKMAAIGVMTAGVAHEINNPLNFIFSGVLIIKQILGIEKGGKIKSSLNDIEQGHLLKVMANIEVGVKRATDIIRSLNLFSRKEQATATECNIHEIIESSLTILHHELKNRIDLDKKFSKKNFVVIGKESRLYQVFTNIISNAIQAIDETGTITIRTVVNKSKDKGIVSILDSGKGMSKEQINRIFDPFYTTKEPGKGTGLGLSITYNILEEHNAQVSVYSELGNGSEFIIEFPISQ